MQRSSGWLEILLCSLVVFAVAIELRLVLLLNLSWDEFHYLSRLYEHSRGELPYRLQTLHVALFSWLPRVSQSEVEQVLAARWVMFAFGIGTRLLLYGIARHFVSRVGALFTVLAYSSFSYVLHHGSSFRFDPLLTFFGLAALALLLHGRGRPASALAGLAFAVASLFSLKSGVFAPTLACTLLLTSANRADFARRSAVFVGAYCAGFGALYLLHASTFEGGAVEAGAYVARIGTSTFAPTALFPRIEYLQQSLRWDAPTWILLGAGIVPTLAMLRGRGRRDALILLSFLIPLGTLVMYRNAFPYFYVMILAPAVPLVGIAVDRVASIRHGRIAVALLAVLVAGTGARFFWEHRTDETTVQREIVDAIHAIFPSPVPYVDRCAMIASYPKVGMFMSRWGMSDYRAAGEPVMRALIETERPVFVLANAAGLEDALARRAAPPPVLHRLLPEDSAALRENYVWHWGVVYVAGKRLPVAGGAASSPFEIAIPGTYTVEADRPVRIDGREIRPGAPVHLGAGAHTIAAAGRATQVTLRWGVALSRPEHAATRERIFAGFTYR